MLNGKHRSVIVSTIREIRGLEPLVESGEVNDILYGLPLAKVVHSAIIGPGGEIRRSTHIPPHRQRGAAGAPRGFRSVGRVREVGRGVVEGGLTDSVRSPRFTF